MVLDNSSIYYTWKNIKSEYNNNKFENSASIWKGTFELPDGSYSIANIQYQFEFVIRKHELLSENPPVEKKICFQNKNRL